MVIVYPCPYLGSCGDRCPHILIKQGAAQKHALGSETRSWLIYSCMNIKFLSLLYSLLLSLQKTPYIKSYMWFTSKDRYVINTMSLILINLINLININMCSGLHSVSDRDHQFHRDLRPGFADRTMFDRTGILLIFTVN